MKFIKELEIGVEEIILMFLILIELLDFFTVIPPIFEFIEKSVALMAMTYLFYKASITKIIFGRKEKFYDAMIVISWFMISLNTVIGFVLSVGEEKILASKLYLLLAQNFFLIEKTGFIAGTVALITLSILLIKERVEKTCLLQIIHEQKKVHDWKHRIIRFFAIYLTLLAFYLLVYGFAIEWLAITVDAPIIVAVLLAYLIFIIKRKKEVKASTLLEKITTKSEEFYENFITLFHAKRTIMTAIAGILALHLLVEIGHYIIPYATGLMYTWYFKQMGAGHDPIWANMLKDIANTGATQSLGIILIYVINLIAILFLFIAPAYLWKHMYKKTPIHLNKFIITGFFTSITIFILSPIFRIEQINSKILMGADILTQQINSIQNVWWVILIGITVGAISYLLTIKNIHKTTKVMSIISLIYFAYYLYHFFIDMAKNYMNATIATMQTGQYIAGTHLFIFFGMTIAFYTTGYFAFVYKAIKERT